MAGDSDALTARNIDDILEKKGGVIMAALKKFTGDTVMFSYRSDSEKWRAFSALTTLRGETATIVFDQAVEKYIAENKGLLAETLANLE
jgi:hypothetical protein